jgi:hypothetical protein
MADSLKDDNKLALYSLMAANLALFYAGVQKDAIMTGDWIELARHFGEVLPAGLGVALMGIINAQFSPEAKSRIVFMRWRNSLPGCEAFTRHAKADARLDIAALERACGSLPTDPRQQNALWYRLYKSVESEPAVMQIHRAFLFARDYTCLALLMTVVLGVAGFLQIPSKRTALIFVVVLLLQFVFAGQAARNNGRRFVTTVLAIKGVGQLGGSTGD